MDTSNTGFEDGRGGADGIGALAGRVRGPVLRPGDGGYDDERAAYQASSWHRPDVIVGADGAQDVAAAVAFATAQGLPVAVQATGHGLPVAARGGVLVTTGRMTGVEVDAAARTARIHAGARWGTVIKEAAAHGLAPLSGSAPEVGAVAYILGGGLGLLARSYGYAADHVRSIDVVTADARPRHVTADSDPDLFWALRGGGGNFGVVTGVEVELVGVTRLYGGALYFDAERVEDLLEVYRRWTATVPEAMTSAAVLIGLPDVPGIPEPIRGRYVGIIRVAFTGDTAEGERLVAPLRAVGPRLLDTLGELPYTEGGTIFDEPTQPHGYFGDSAMVRELDPAALRSVLDIAGPDAPVMCVVELRHLGGALARPPAVGNAVGHRAASHCVRLITPLDDRGLDPVRPVHARLFEALAPWSLGRCLNFIYSDGTPEPPDAVRSAYDPDAFQRLTELKAFYDPANTFRFNHNIPMAGPTG